MRKDETTGAVLGCLAALIAIPINALWSGYVLSVLWGWFIVTTFEARPLGVLPAIGMALVVGYLTKQQDTYTDKDKSASQRLVESFAYSFLSPLVALVFGWVLHSFM